MKPNRLAGAALIVSSIGLIVTMAIHPTGGGHEKIAREARLATGVHAFAIACVWLQACGFLGFTRMMRPKLAFADAGLVAFAIAAVCGMLAATVSGILSPVLHERAAAADPADHALWEVVFSYNFRLNSALTQVFIGAISVAVAIWSLAALRISRGWTYLGAAGIVIGVAALFTLFTGRIRNNVHDVGLFVLATSAWSIALGALLFRLDEPSSAWESGSAGT